MKFGKYIIRQKQEEGPLDERREALGRIIPYLGLVSAPPCPRPLPRQSHSFLVATYNVHRWEPPGKRGAAEPERATEVITEIDADITALQEVIRPWHGDDPLARLAHDIGRHVAFVATRIHPQGELGNAILSRWPMVGASILDLRFSRIERRTAIMTKLESRQGALSLVSTHLALLDRTRHRQIRRLLDQPAFQEPVILLGDMNLWRLGDPSHRLLEAALPSRSDLVWPRSFPAMRPVLPLDRIYAKGAKVLDIHAHDSPAARRASDHLPVVARISRL